jgi:hypothetical protein
MSLPLQWREWAFHLMRYGVRFAGIGHTGHSDATLLSDGDEDDRASEREPLAFAPALSECRHCSLARRLNSQSSNLDRCKSSRRRKTNSALQSDSCSLAPHYSAKQAIDRCWRCISLGRPLDPNGQYSSLATIRRLPYGLGTAVQTAARKRGTLVGRLRLRP